MGFIETILIALGVLTLLVIVYVILYNRLQRLRVKVEEAGSGIAAAPRIGMPGGRQKDRKSSHRWASDGRLSSIRRLAHWPASTATFPV